MRVWVSVGMAIAAAALVGVIAVSSRVFAQNQAPVNQSGATVSAIKVLKKSELRKPTETEMLQSAVETLKKESAAQKIEIEKLRSDLAALTQRVNGTNANPAGYNVLYITKDNWSRLANNTLLKVWTRR